MVIELDWTILSIWIGLSRAGRCLPKGSRISPIQIFRVLAGVLTDVAAFSTKRLNVRELLSRCVVADESNRKSEKNSRHYPRKKKKRPTGEPTVRDLPTPLQKAAAKMLG